MTEITATMVKDLREKTGAGMMDCKKALTEVQGDFEMAVDWLRKKGLSAAAKKAGRVAAEGLVGAVAQGTEGALVEVNAETDFVARNEHFQNFVKEASAAALKSKGHLEQLAQSPTAAGASVQEALTELIAVIGENMTLRRTSYLAVPQGVVASYIHNATVAGLGRIGVLVALESATSQTTELTEIGRKIAMHIAASTPLALSTDDVDPALLERERSILVDQAKASGRAPDIIEKMVEGRLRKYYEEVVLLEQAFVMNPEQKIKQVVEEAAKTFGAPVKLAAFVRFALGDGIEKTQINFAEEVAQQLRS
jgi:elongation factor Ts